MSQIPTTPVIEELNMKIATHASVPSWARRAAAEIARLNDISADLLAALKLAYEHINGGPGIKTGAEFQAMWEQVGAAIAKAEGRE